MHDFISAEHLKQWLRHAHTCEPESSGIDITADLTPAAVLVPLLGLAPVAE